MEILKKWLVWVIILAVILAIFFLILIFRSESDCPSGYVIVDCNPGNYCVSESEARIIDCATIATSASEKDSWSCTGIGFQYKCNRKR